MTDIEACRTYAISVLHRCAHTIGLKASARVDGYPQIWARDSMITLLGACLTDNVSLHQSLKLSIEALAKYQTELGLIPNNVDVNNNSPNYQAYADTGLWYIIGNVVLFEATDDLEFLKKQYPQMLRAMLWYEYQDVDQSGLLTTAEASDWQDLLATRNKTLYVNMLFHLALSKIVIAAKAMQDDVAEQKYIAHTARVKQQINDHFWYGGDSGVTPHVRFCFGTSNVEDLSSIGISLFLPQKRLLVNEQYYLPYLTFRNFGEWFDSFGHLLSILGGVADETKCGCIFSFIDKHTMASPHPIKAIYPPIQPGDPDWREYYRFANLNLPDQYHNGGIWPFLGGFYVAALVKAGKHEQAQLMLERLADMNEKGLDSRWEFNEWYHGVTGEPKGMQEQAWSAGMYLYAYECVKRKKALWF